MIKIIINNGDNLGDVDYTRYVTPGSVKITQGLNVPTQCNFSLTGINNVFKTPVPRAYVKIYSSLYKRFLFTGFLVTDPASSFVGLSTKVPGTDFQMYQYDLSCTSDDYLLNIKSVPFIPAFVNKTQGQILQLLAEILAPGYFNYDNIDSGDLVPYFAYDPTKSWYQYAKDFGDASKYRYSCIDKEIHFKPYGDGHLGIVYDEELGEGTFDPKAFSSTPLTTPLVNDVTIIGSEEGGNNCEDFFIGTGFNGAFPLNRKVYGLASNFQGSSILLADQWNGQELNTQNWFVQDPASQFNYTNGALNILSGDVVDLGLSFIKGNSALELAGAIIAQHGEVVFNDISQGIIGGFYNDSTLAVSGCLAGFDVRPGPVVSVSISGAAGIEIRPILNGVLAAQGFVVSSLINKTYTLYTRTSSPLPVRYHQTYRSLAGSVFGGYTTAPTVTGSITYAVQETDIFTGQIQTWTHTEQNVTIPDTVIYGLINNQELNISLSNTQIWTPPPATLKIGCEIAAGALAPIYISGNVQFTGAFVTPSGGNLPIMPDNLGPEQQFDLGSGIGNQAAQISSGQTADTLNFYSNDLPAAGTRIRLQSWQSQTAVSRMRSAPSIAAEAAVVGDDGIRASTVSNLTPLPRTSEDCDNAASAFLHDRTSTAYQGSYKAAYYFFQQYTDDIEFFPVCGRWLYVNSPHRNIIRQNMLVSAITTTIQELASEVIYYDISFGPDMYIEKILESIRPVPNNTLTPVDASIQPTPQYLTALGTNYLPDVFQTTVVGQISGAQFGLCFQDALVSGAMYEVRSADINWGNDDSYLLFRLDSNFLLSPYKLSPVQTDSYNGMPTYLIPRTQYEQSWFIRQVINPNSTDLHTSRRTKVLRIVYPRIPTAPLLLTADTANVDMDLSGDTRNIEGLEIRQQDDITVVYRTLIGTRFDSAIDMDLLRNQLLPGQSGLTGLGKILVEPFAASGRLLNAHFFNLMWEYSPVLTVTMPPFSAPIVSLGYRWGPRIQVNVQAAGTDVIRTDVKYTQAQFFNNPSLAGDPIQDISQQGNSGMIVTTVPVTDDLYIRVRFIDHVGEGDWSDIIYVPQGDLIASDYLTGQGSVPPVVLANFGGGGVMSYASYVVGSGILLNIYCQAFKVWFPNGTVVVVPPASGSYTDSLDGFGALQPSTTYGFFPALWQPVSPTPALRFNGPYFHYSGSTLSLQALTGVYQDGSVPLTNGAFVVSTTPASGGGGGGGGGSVIRVDIRYTGGGWSPGDVEPLIFSGDGTGAEGYAYMDEYGSVVTTAVTKGGTGYTTCTATIGGIGSGAVFDVVLGTPGSGGGA